MKKTLFLTAILGAALCSTAWAETATVDNSAHTGLNLNNAPYNAADTVIFNITSAANKQYFANNAQTYSQNIQMGDGSETQGGMWINDGYGNQVTFTGALTGSGMIKKTGAGTGLKIAFTGNATGYTGNIELDANNDFTLRFGGEDVTASATTAEKGVSGTGAITFKSNANSTLVYNYAASATPVYITNEIKRASGTSKVQFLGGAAYTLTKNATIDVLTIGNGSSITVDSGTTLALKSDSTWVITGETERTEGNGLGTATVTKDFGTSLVNNGTITVGGHAATFDNGVVTGTGDSTTYYVNQGAYINGRPAGAAKMIVNKTTGNAANTFGLGSATYGDMDIIINSGRVITAHDDSNSITSGAIVINGGGTFAIVEGGQDALGWNTTADKTIELNGEDEDHKATFDLSYNNDAAMTMTRSLNLNGYSQVTGNRVLSTFGGNITATGTNNVISTEVALRKAASIVVNEDSALEISGAVTYGQDNERSMTKTGAGVLTISGAIRGNSANELVAITGDGANTILSGTSISNSTLNNVTLTSSDLTLTGTMEMNDVTLRHAMVNNSTLTLSGTVNYTGELVDSGTVARTEGNGLGFTTAKGTLISRGSGSTNKDAVTSWQVNGDSTGVSYADGALTKITGDSDIYYINNQGAALTAQKTGTLNAGTYTGMTAELVVGTNGAAEGVTLTVDGTTEVATTGYVEVYHNSTLNLEDTAHVSANSGANLALWMHNGSTVNMAAGATVSADGVDFKGGTITATGDTQIGGSKGTPSNATITGSAITVNDGKTLRKHNVVGGSITTKGTATINATLSDTAKTDLLVTSDSTAKFSAGNVNLKKVTLEADSTVTLGTEEAHNYTLAMNTLQVDGAGATVNANLDLTNSLVALNGNSVALGCDVKLSGTSITLSSADMLTLFGNETTEAVGELKLFTSAESVTLASGTTTSSFIMKASEAGITVLYPAGEENVTDRLFLKYTGADGTGIVSLTTVPEPATATLSLLALAALAARRRRH